MFVLVQISQVFEKELSLSVQYWYKMQIIVVKSLVEIPRRKFMEIGLLSTVQCAVSSVLYGQYDSYGLQMEQ